MTSAFENLCGPGKPLKAEPPDAKEFAGLLRSGKARLKDAGAKGLALAGGMARAVEMPQHSQSRRVRG